MARPSVTAIIFLLSVGITLHDIASILGFHIEGLHALYFSVPIALFAFLLWRRENFRLRS